MLQNVKKLKKNLTHEKLSPVIAVLKSESREDGIEKARQMVEFHGLGHSAAIHTEDAELANSDVVRAIRVIWVSFYFRWYRGHYSIYPIINIRLPGSYRTTQLGDNVSVVNLLNIKMGRREIACNGLKFHQKSISNAI